MERLNSWDYILVNMPALLDGLWFSLKLFGIVLLIAFPLAILCAIGKVSGPKWLKAILSFYTWVFRGTPLVAQLFLVYFGFPYIGIVLSKMTVAVIIFSLSVAAYETEIVRGGIISIELGQYEACKALGLNFFKTMQRVVIPQTIRKVLPTSCSEAIILFKDTSLVAGIALFDLMRQANNLVTTQLRIEPYVVALFFYLLISSLLVFLFGKLEKRFSLGFD